MFSQTHGGNNLLQKSTSTESSGNAGCKFLHVPLSKQSCTPVKNTWCFLTENSTCTCEFSHHSCLPLVSFWLPRFFRIDIMRLRKQKIILFSAPFLLGFNLNPALLAGVIRKFSQCWEPETQTELCAVGGNCVTHSVGSREATQSNSLSREESLS